MLRRWNARVKITASETAVMWIHLKQGLSKGPTVEYGALVKRVGNKCSCSNCYLHDDMTVIGQLELTTVSRNETWYEVEGECFLWQARFLYLESVKKQRV